MSESIERSVVDTQLARAAAPAALSQSITRGQWLTLVAALLGWMFDGMEMGIFPIIGRPALQSLLGSSSEGLIAEWFSFITAVFLVGAALGGVLFGWLGDRIGRVHAMTASVLVYSVFTGACYFADTPWHLAILRFVAALGMGGEWALGVALVMETWPGIARPVLAGLIGAASNVGFLLIGIVTLSFRADVQNWRWVMLVGAAPAALTFFIRIFVPESERWKSAVVERTRSPLAEVFSGPQLKTTLLAIAFGSIALVGTWGSVQWIPSWIDKIAVDQPGAKSLASILSSAGAIVGSFLGAAVGVRLDRRAVYFTLCLSSLLVCGYLFRAMGEFNAAMLAVIGLAGCVTAAFYGWLPLYLPELFPTRMRATGQGLAFNFGRIVAAFASLQTGALVKRFDGSIAQAAAATSLVYALGLVLIWLAPETRGRPLPE
ncbi:MAG: MFS transporter [Pirellulales bacterium]|nr:MFS transporter [Pirellulales bacterium]